MNETITIWVGLDVHKNTIAVCALRGGDEKGEDFEIRNEPELVRRFFKKLKKQGDLRCCYEAGPCGYTLRRQLKKMDITCDVIAPTLMHKGPGHRIKNDRRDAQFLAKQLRGGGLTKIHVPDEQEEAARDLARCREAIRKNLTRARARLTKFLDRHGRVWRETEHWTVRHFAWLQTQRFDESAAQITYDEYFTQLQFNLERRSGIDRAIREIAAKEPWRDQVAMLRSLRGVNVLTAFGILVEIQDFRRFSSPKELTSFIGLVPSLHESARRGFHGPITKTGNAHARRLLIEAAWHYQHKPKLYPALAKRMAGQPEQVRAHSMKAQRRLHDKYRRLVERGRPKNLAAVSVARELAGFMWALLVKHGAAVTTKPAPDINGLKPATRIYRLPRRPRTGASAQR
jgi:transposase